MKTNSKGKSYGFIVKPKAEANLERVGQTDPNAHHLQPKFVDFKPRPTDAAYAMGQIASKNEFSKANPRYNDLGVPKTVDVPNQMIDKMIAAGISKEVEAKPQGYNFGGVNDNRKDRVIIKKR